MPNLFDKTEEEILNLIKEQSEIGDDLIVVGRFVNYKGKDNFINIRNKNFVPLTYVGQGNEHIGQKIKIEIRERHSYPLEKEWYEFKIKLGEEGLRRFLNNPTLITIDLSFEPKVFQPREKEFVLNLYKRKSNQSLETDRGNIQSLRIIEREINRVKEAFIYELLQNADDYPLASKKVDVKIFTTSNEFIFSHNGSPFKFNNVYAICNINDGDKQDDADKIGYKGIGFKSVFAYSEKVLVKSGKYIFKFDKKHPEFQREKPFQIIPIWIENLNSLKELPIKENVNIVIEAKQGKSQIEEWKELLNDIFSQESSTPVILFLRNIRNVSIDRTLVSQTTREWWIREYKLKLTDEIKSEIKRHFETNTGNIPEKLVGVDEIEIQFSLKHLDYEIIPLPEAILYNYLPTKVNLGFTFLVNSDFIPTGDRHYLFENEWNKYLMKEVGRKFFDWLNTLYTVKHKTTEQAIFKKDYLKLLPSLSKNIQELKSKTSNNLFLLEAFKQGFDLSLLGTETNPAIPFIPTQIGTLETLSNILIDETGLADLLKEQFAKLTGINGKLIHNEVGEGEEKVKALITEYKQGTVYGIENLKATLKTEVVQEWLKTPPNNFNLIQHFNSKKELQSLLETETIILSESRQLFKSPSLFNSIPNELTFASTEKISSDLSSLLSKNNVSLKLAEFEPIKFFKENIQGKQNTINATLTDEANLLNFWKFVFNNWAVFESDTAIKDSLKHFEILCKPKKENEFSKKAISSAYLSAEFNSANEIESVVKEISPEALFISNKYIVKESEAEKWRKIFKLAGAIADLQKVIEILITKLPDMEDSKHFEIAKQIFKFWKDNKDTANKLTDLQIAQVQTNLKIKCADNIFRKTTECYLSDHYNNNRLLTSWIPSFELTNQISQAYAPRTNQVAEWKIFFGRVGCVELSDKQNVFDAKLASYIDKQDSMQDKHFEFLKSISDLHKLKNENGLSFKFENTFSEIKLQASNEEWHLPKNIHLSNSFKPKLTLQSDEKINSTLLFLNENYFQNQIEKYFLTDIGVQSDFKFYTYELKRNEIPTYYRQEFENKSAYILQNAQQYAIQHRLHNHIDLNYRNLLSEAKYAEIFWKEVKKANSKHIQFLFQESIYKMAFHTVLFENLVVNFIKKNETFPNQSNDLKKSTELYSALLADYITDKNDLPKYDLSDIYFNNDQSKSLESLLGIQKLLSQKHCIELFSRIENRSKLEQITELQIVKILTDYKLSDDEKTKLFLLNINLEWKPISELFISKNEEFPVEPSQNLHEDFYSIANNFGIQELSEENLVLKTKPQTPAITDEIGLFFSYKAKFIAFKIDHTNYEEVEAEIIEKISAFEFYEVTSMAKVFPKINPIYKEELSFYYEEDENKIYYKGNWKTNSELIIYLHKNILVEKIPEAWFENVINRWDEKEIFHLLKGEFGNIPPLWESVYGEIQASPEDGTDSGETIWDDYSEDEASYIKEIVNISYNKEGQEDANTTAKIKTLMFIKDDYGTSIITDEGRYLTAGNDEIVVRSAQRGLLYLDLFDWEKLNRDNAKLAVYSNNQVNIFDSQEELFQYCKPQNKFGVLRMPDDYTLDDYNNLDKITDKGKWHYVFIVNENSKAAKNYNEVMNLDDYNF